MAVTHVFSGQLAQVVSIVDTQSGDVAGSISVGAQVAQQLTNAGASNKPDISGWLAGTVSPNTSTDYLIAAATAPFGSYSDGFAAAGKKVKAIFLQNQDATNAVSVKRKTTNGLPFLDAATAGIVLGPAQTGQAKGDSALLIFEAGLAALTTGSNDGITVVPAAGSPALLIIIAYGP